MNIPEFIKQLTGLGVMFHVQDSELKVRSPKGVISAEMAAAIQLHKTDIIRFLQNTLAGYIPKADKKAYYPLSAAQRRLYFLHELNKSSLAYNVPKLVKLEGNADREKLRKAFHQLIERHSSLRTSFKIIDAVPVQVIAPDVDFEIVEYTTGEGTVEDVIARFIQPFDLSKAPLLRVGLISISETAHILMTDLHHIISDGVSDQLLLRDFMTFYKGESLPALQLEYHDYAEWQQSAAYTNATAVQQEYWRREFAELPEPLAIHTDFQRPVVRSFRGDVVSFELDIATTTQLKQLAEKQKVSMFMLLLSILQVFLSKLSGQEDIVVGTVTSGRQHYDLEGVIGMFVNTLVLRGHPSGNRQFTDFLQEVKSRVLAAFENQQFQYEELIDELDVKRDQSRNPLFDVIFSYANFEPAEFQLPDLKLTAIPYQYRVSKFDLLLVAEEHEGSIACVFEYSTDIFTKETIKRFATYFRQAVTALVSTPSMPLDTLELMTAAEKEQQLISWNNTTRKLPAAETVITLFEKQVLLNPEKTAVTYLGNSLSYAALEEKSNALAQELADRGIGIGSLVGVLLAPSEYLLVAIIGILKTGAAYVPVDTAYPLQRKQYMVTNSGFSVLVSTDELIGAHLDILQHISFSNLIDITAVTEDSAGATFSGMPVAAEALAYVLYTSGSTGLPKGVMITHGALFNYLYWANETYIHGESADMALFTSIAFDLTITSVFLPLISGNTVYVYDQGGDGLPVQRVVADGHATILKLTPSHLKVLCEQPGALSGIKRLIVGGEQFEESLARRIWEKTGGATEIYNEYGPTEATVGCVLYQYDRHSAHNNKNVPIGKPVANTRIYILDKSGQMVPCGTPGELHIGGAQLFAGYLHAADQTGQRLLADPFLPGEKMYRTGDLACWQTDGNLLYLGRVDEQVKIRGYRIELGEIAMQLLNIAGMTGAVAAVKERGGEAYLVAYYVSATEADPQELKNYLSERLPEYMVPAYYVRLESIPLSANGKVDRRLLPDPEMKADSNYVAPSGETEIRLVKIWSEMLGTREEFISVKSNFFEIGGNSLRAISLASRIHKEFEVDIAVSDLFRNASISRLAICIGGLQKKAFLAINAIDKKPYYKLSSAQRRLYFLHELDKSSLAYNIPHVVKLEGKLDRQRLEEAFIRLVDRHSSLRTSFSIIEGEPVQIVKDTVPFQIAIYDTGKATVSQLIHEFIRPFDLSNATLLRVGLILLAPEEYILMVDLHHIISDGISRRILMKDFMALYAGEELPPLQLEYKDYAEWQQSDTRLLEVESHRDFWKQTFKDLPEQLALYTDFQRPSVRSFNGDTLTFELDKNVTGKLKSLSEEQHVSMFMLLLSVFNVFLSKLSGQEDIVVGTVTSGRQHYDLEGVIGMFVNTLVLRCHPSGNRQFTNFLQEVKSCVLAAFEHQQFQYEELIDELDVKRDQSRNPLFDVIFSYANFEPSEFQLPDLKLTAFPYQYRVSKFDLLLVAEEHEGSIACVFEYSTDIFTKETIKRFATYFRQAVTALVSTPSMPLGTLELMTAAEKEQQLISWNNTARTWPAAETVITLFEKQVLLNPEKTAVTYLGNSLSYAALEEKSNALAQELADRNIGIGSLVGVLLAPSEYLLVAIMGILKTGAAYVPVDTAYPLQRKQYMVTNSGFSVLVSTDELIGAHLDILQHISFSNLIDITAVTEDSAGATFSGMPVAAEALAYVLYTSGSTGQPKGVMITHGALFNYLYWANETYIRGESGDMALFTSIAFDLTITSVFLPLISGNTVYVYDQGGDGLPVQRVVTDGHATIIKLTPSHLKVLCEQPGALSGIKRLIVGGEQFEEGLARRIWEKTGGATEIYNEYGPTEATVGCVLYQYDPHSPHNNKNVPIGKPVANTRIYILDKAGQMVPCGTPGELHIGGAQLFAGYLHAAAQTGQRLLTDPFLPGEKMYRTGDLACWQTDGNLLYLGRVDEQVKIRGYRIELGEIAMQLLNIPDITGAVAAVKERGGEAYLVAYYVSATEADPQELKNYLSERLPEYMVPAYYVRLESIPLSANGKVDRRLLPDPEMKADSNYVAPSGETEIRLVKIWSEMLGTREEFISVKSNFFEVGGNSLRAISLGSRIYREFGITVSLVDIFKYTTISKLAHFLQHPDNMAAVTEAEDAGNPEDVYSVISRFEMEE